MLNFSCRYKLSWIFYFRLFQWHVWNPCFISYNSTMIKICYCYWKIVDDLENSEKNGSEGRTRITIICINPNNFWLVHFSVSAEVTKILNADTINETSVYRCGSNRNYEWHVIRFISLLLPIISSRRNDHIISKNWDN